MAKPATPKHAAPSDRTQIAARPPADALHDAVLARLAIPTDDLLSLSVPGEATMPAAGRRSAWSTPSTSRSATKPDVLRRASDDPVSAPALIRAIARCTRPHRAVRPVVIGTGPCGLLAALTLAQMGFRPIILERGKLVRERTRDTWGLWRRGVLNPESNVQFGEGGAGTFSDGKLYTGIKDPRHLGRKVLTEFVEAGAPEEILYVSKPHIGTFRLVTVVEGIRAKIEALGGEYRFRCARRGSPARIADDRHIRGLTLASGEQIEADHVVLAIGHSARDTFAMLHRRGVHIEAKPFSIGARIEHPQALIDRARFGAFAGHPRLVPADYKLVHHASNGRSVYSFCMCPGGRVVAATSELGCVATNGMSQYSRAEFNANAGIVVGVTPADYAIVDPAATPRPAISPGRHRLPAAMGAPRLPRRRQHLLPRRRNWSATCSRAKRRGAGRRGTLLPAGVCSQPTSPTACRASPIEAIREALRAFDRDIPGFAMHDAVLTGVETRYSSPIRIPRGLQVTA